MKIGHIWNTWTVMCAVENERWFYSQSFFDPKNDHFYDSKWSISLPDEGFSAFAINKVH